MTRLPAAALCLLAAASPLATPAPDPAALAAEIAATGARATVNRLCTANLFETVLTRIGSGADNWVALAPTLAPGTDAASAEGLTIALATALPHNPAAVLRATTPTDGPNNTRRVCSTPFIEPTPTEITAYTTTTLAALDTITTPTLQPARTTCTAALRS